MTAQQRPFVRVYYEILDDPKFETIYGDDQALAWWLRLLIGADATWPASAVLPRGVPDEALEKLVDVKLVDVKPGDRYRIHGLDRERETVRSAAREAANARWAKGRRQDDAGPMRTHMRPDAPALQEQSGGDGHPMLSAPLRSAPIRSAPLLAREAPPAPVNGGGAPTRLSDILPPPPGHPSMKDRPKRPPPDDEELVARYKAKADDPDEPPDMRSVAEAQLAHMGWVRAEDGSWQPRTPGDA